MLIAGTVAHANKDDDNLQLYRLNSSARNPTECFMIAKHCGNISIKVGVLILQPLCASSFSDCSILVDDSSSESAVGKMLCSGFMSSRLPGLP